MPFGSRSRVLPSPALIYCPRVATEMRAVDILPGSHLSHPAARCWVGFRCGRGVAGAAAHFRCRGCCRAPEAGCEPQSWAGRERGLLSAMVRRGLGSRRRVGAAGAGASHTRGSVARGRPHLPFKYSPQTELLCSQQASGSLFASVLVM